MGTFSYGFSRPGRARPDRMRRRRSHRGDREHRQRTSRSGSSGQVPRVLHRATCESLLELGDEYQVISGTRDELEQDVMDENDRLCPVCSESPRGLRLRAPPGTSAGWA